MKECENCKNEHTGDYGSGRFCSNKCARGFSTKEKRLEINEKVKLKLIKDPHVKYCKVCKIEFKTKLINAKYCSKKCIALFYKTDKEYLNKLSLNSLKRCSTLEEKERMKKIGRLGGFGKKGYTNNGTYYQSNLEKNCFEFLESINIEYDAHKNIPNDSRETDIFLKDKNIWIELDGINREKKKKYLKKNYDKWIKKIQRYHELELNLKIIYDFIEFKNYINILYNLK